MTLIFICPVCGCREASTAKACVECGHAFPTLVREIYSGTALWNQPPEEVEVEIVTVDTLP